MEGLLAIAQKEFGAVTDVWMVEHLRQVTTFRRKAEWDIRKFRRVFRYVKLLAKQVASITDGNILFMHLLGALNLSDNQRHMVLSYFETVGLTKNVARLQDIDIRLFGTYGSQHIETFVMADGAEQEDSGSESEEVLSMRKKPKIHGKPGMETTAVRRTIIHFRGK